MAWASSPTTNLCMSCASVSCKLQCAVCRSLEMRISHVLARFRVWWRRRRSGFSRRLESQASMAPKVFVRTRSTSSSRAPAPVTSPTRPMVGGSSTVVLPCRNTTLVLHTCRRVAVGKVSGLLVDGLHPRTTQPRTVSLWEIFIAGVIPRDGGEDQNKKTWAGDEGVWKKCCVAEFGCRSVITEKVEGLQMGRWYR